MIKAVIFDIDGTLIDSVDLHARAWQETFKHFGKDIPFDQVRKQIGKGGDQLMPVFFSKEELKEISEEMEEFRSHLFKSAYLPQVKAFPRVRELFERIKEDDKEIVLASSAKADELETYKKLANIADLVKTETSADDVERSKPHPDVFEVAIAKLKDVVSSPKEVVVIGDSPYDAEAAAKVRIKGERGIATVAVLCGGFSENDLRKARCLAFYQDPADLLVNYHEWISKAENTKAFTKKKGF